jgi:hypothetical protein
LWCVYVLYANGAQHIDRFESDMLAFSGCYYGGGDIERRELGEIRKRWKTLHVREYYNLH